MQSTRVCCLLRNFSFPFSSFSFYSSGLLGVFSEAAIEALEGDKNQVSLFIPRLYCPLNCDELGTYYAARGDESSRNCEGRKVCVMWVLYRTFLTDWHNYPRCLWKFSSGKRSGWHHTGNNLSAVAAIDAEIGIRGK